MNTEALFLFLILLLGLVLSSFLGGNCNNEGFTTSSSSLISDSTFRSQSGGTAVLKTPTNNQQTLTVVLTRGQPPLTFYGSSSSKIFTGPEGYTATLTTFNGLPAIQVKASNGRVLDTFNQTGNTSTSTTSTIAYDNYNHYNGSSTHLVTGTTLYGPNGGSINIITDSNGKQKLKVIIANGQSPMIFSPTKEQESNNSYYETHGPYTTYYGTGGSATVEGEHRDIQVKKYKGPNGAEAFVIQGNNGDAVIHVKTSSGIYTYMQSSYNNPDKTTSTKYYGSTGSPIQPSDYSLAYERPYGGSASLKTGPQDNSAYYAPGPQGNSPSSTNSSEYGNQYNDSLPRGIPKSQIPSGNEDLYILKSQVVPPVCPVCPVGAACPRQEKCPPCPACARCPEPSFECKKVPNYNAIGSNQLPLPVLNDFSSFGM